MSNIEIRMLTPDEYPLAEEFCQREGIECPHPEFSWIEAAFDGDRMVGIVVAQMLIHTEPIWISREYQGGRIKEELMDRMEGRLDASALTIGKPIHVYNQPTNAAAERICRLRGYVKSDRPLYNKIYTGEKLLELITKGNIEEDR